MSPISWVRVDDRLIHGQVTVAWRRYLRYDEIWVVDDKVRADPLLLQVLPLAAPPGVAVHVYSVQEAVEAASSPPAGNVLVLLKEPQTALSLLERGFELPHLNVGCLSASPDSKRVYRSISLDPDQYAALTALAECGVTVFLQLTPDDPRVEWPRTGESR